jgi:hypothetical protein
MILIELLFAGKNSEDQEFHSGEKYGHHNSFVASVTFVLGGTSTRDLPNSEWIGNEMRIKIFVLW